MNHLKSGTAFFGQGSYKNNKYNGKELQETGLYDYGWRNYMPDIARWNGIDQLAENYLSTSPYAYVMNNPINLMDPDGRASEAWLAEAPDWLRDSWTNTPNGSNSYWYNNGSGFTSYDGGPKGGGGGRSIMYGSTVGYGGGFTMGDGIYTLPPLVLSGYGTSKTWGSALSNYNLNHSSIFNGIAGMQTAWNKSMFDAGRSLSIGELDRGGIMMIGGTGDPLGVFDIAGQYLSNLEPQNRYAAMAIGLFAAVALKKPGLITAEEKIIIGNGGNYVSSMNIIREVQKGEKISDLVALLQNRTLSTGVEHAVVKLGNNSVAPGARVIVSGGPHGISFGAGEVSTIFGHTHPFVTGPSAGDFRSLEILNQSRQYIIEGFNPPIMIRKP
ncbi:RHS repeat-associated core domain-containing protein [Chryseobacterium sp. G0201]|uniref:RHS repeat-associated core domain-containing protein n=1 Tax=Chryseobacterium sp. G0201 TaxID=2487065 RepID=UPI000F4F1EC7|nr:RHS repeat-associated core domain-containing protein [Chryseobacterium sp. G0201]AZA51545.1 RHS repeat-associated core domain-containing protein [Chryseobacterium sp. G0201]